MHLDGDMLSESMWGSEVASAALTLARRAQAGATIWCWSPEWPHHAAHVAVEFVHPVVVGTRALPAEVVVGPDPAPPLRALARSGDVLVIISGPSSKTNELLQRAAAWGLTTAWIGTGPRPPVTAADHVIWLQRETTNATGMDGDSVFDGDIVCTYHVLWELTHVCFEHPGLLSEPDGVGACSDLDGAGHCITCADEGRLAEVAYGCLGGTVTVRTPAGLEEADVTLVAPVEAGDLVLVHAGVAIARIDTP